MTDYLYVLSGTMTTRSGTPRFGALFSVYDAFTGGTRINPVLSYPDKASSSVVVGSTSDAGVRFYLTDINTTVYLDDGSHPRLPVEPDGLAVRLAIVEESGGGGGGGGGLVDGEVTNAKMDDMAASRIKGRNSGGGTGPPEDLTGTQVSALLPVFSGDSGSGGVKGQVPAPATGDAALGRFLSAAGTWSVPDLGNVTRVYGDGPDTAVDRPVTAGLVDFYNCSNPSVNNTLSPGDRWLEYVAATEGTGGGGGTPSGLVYGWDGASTTVPDLPDVKALTVGDALPTGYATMWGPFPGLTLTVINGDLHTSSAGQIINAVDVRGNIIIDHANVIVMNFKSYKVVVGALSKSSQPSTKLYAGIVGRIGSPGGVCINVKCLDIARVIGFGCTDIYHPTYSWHTTQAVCRDYYFHSPSLVYDSGQTGAQGSPNSHSDLIQLDGPNGDVGNFLFKNGVNHGWSFIAVPSYAPGGVAEVPTVYDGPHMYNNSHSTSISDGLMTSCFIGGTSPGQILKDITFTGGVWRGHDYGHFNIGAGAVNIVINSTRSDDSYVAGRNWVSDNGAASLSGSGNVDFRTGSALVVP